MEAGKVLAVETPHLHQRYSQGIPHDHLRGRAAGGGQVIQTSFLNTTVDQEACLNNLAPTSSTTTQMVMGDALAVTLMEVRGFDSEDFARFHPGGTLGKKLYLRVQDLYVHNERPLVHISATLREVIMEITSKR